MPRGRLIFPFLVELAQLDTEQTSKDPDGPGPLTSGYDFDFREPVIIQRTPTDVKGEAHRVERCIECAAQIEDRAFEAIRQVLGGTSPQSKITLVLHFRDLEDRGLVDENGRAAIRVNDRLSKISDVEGNVIETIRNPPGLFVTSVTSAGFGIGTKRNLLLVELDERELGGQAPAR